MMTDMDATALLRDARMHAGLSQAALAEAAGTSQSAIARYETGAAQPSLTTLERLLAACGQRLELRAVPTARLSRVNGSVVRRHRRELLEVARGYGARNVRVFGSTARGDAGPESDVDLLVDLEPGRTLLDLVALRREASALLGLKVDVATFDTLRDAVRVEAQRDAVLV
jgi:predicted nucleotidyltransferase/DNA-binding XRE family transcriptional regulator